MPAPTLDLDALEARLDACLGADRPAFGRRIKGLRRRFKERKPIDKGLARLSADMITSAERLERRKAKVIEPRFDDQLPINQRREDIAKAITGHPVVVVCGETGSGKTTQLPKICLGLGLGTEGLIGHTQPRRIAARSVATRLSEELDSPLGERVGYKVRFSDRGGLDVLVRLMTDGILLAETQGDPLLSHYQVIIVDEAHERSLNIDFLLGYLKRLLPKRPDLKVIITSATIDPERFSRHFDGAPIIEVSGRTYPVEVRYRPLILESPAAAGEDDESAGEEERDQEQAILDAVEELSHEGPGDILVFLAGEREIREVGDALAKRRLPHTEIVPLFARLSAAEQNRVFQPHTGRRIVLATNVAETSLTVPGIRYVIDPGYARISRYSPRVKVQRLPIEKISQASANQRAGRCGRVAEGICIRLYSEADFQSRPAFTDPEILRTNLAAVILQMEALELGAVEDFPFLEPPDSRLIGDGYRLLFELQAVDQRQHITPLGQKLARLPIDPRLGRMVLAGAAEGALEETLVIASALAVQDPRERPLDRQQAADERHRRFADEQSDFAALLNLWRYAEECRTTLTQNQWRQRCREEFLSFVRLREWRDLKLQLQEQAAELKLKAGAASAESTAVHRALLAGLLDHVGLKQDPEQHFLGARGRKFYLFPGSGLFKKPPKWLMAAELVETTRLYARTCAKLDPRWLEELAPHLVKRSYGEPRWEKRPAQVAANEQVTLLGLPIVANRRVNYGPIDPPLAQQLFIRHALVRGEYQTEGGFVDHNRRLIEEVEALEAKTRRRDVLVDEDTLHAFFEQRLPVDVYSGAAFERWRKGAERDNPKVLWMVKGDLMARDALEVTGDKYPDALLVNGIELPLNYHFDPGGKADGITVMVPLAALNQVDPRRLEWLVPGLLPERMTALLKSLPKSLRRSFVPVPDYVQALVEALPPQDKALTAAMAERLQAMTGVKVPEEAWNPAAIPEHLHFNIQVVDPKGKVLAEGRDLVAIRKRLQGHARESFAALPTPEFERDEVRDWDFGPLPEKVSFTRNGITLKGYPALVDRQDRVSLVLWDVPERAQQAHHRGVRALITLRQRDKIKYLKRHLPRFQTMALHFMATGNQEQLREDLVAAITDRAYLADDPLPRDKAAFEGALARGGANLMTVANDVCGLVADVLAAHHRVRKTLGKEIPLSWFEAVADIKDQLDHLVYPGFVQQTPEAWLVHLPRYLKAVEVRLEKLRQAPDKDRQRRAPIADLWSRYKAQLAKDQALNPALVQFRWMLEELRVSQFAQELKTAMPVSAKRLEAQWAAVK